MALDLTALTDYINENSKEFVTRAITENDTVKYLNSIGALRVGVKGKEAIQILDADVNIQSNDSCGRTASGDTSFSQANLEVVPLADFQNYCPKDFEKKWMSQYLTKGQHYTELLFAEDMMNVRASLLAKANEKLIWQGDSEETDANLNKFDGVLKQLDDAGVTATDLSAETDVVAQLQAIVAGADADEVGSGDFTIFLGKDKATAYQIALANKNLFREGDNLKVYGTDIAIVGVSGLNGTGLAVSGRASHFVVGTDLVSDLDTATLEYSVETKQFYMDFQWALGVTVAFPDEKGLFSLDANGGGVEG